MIGVVEGDGFALIVDLNNKSAEDVGAEDTLHFYAGVFGKAEIVFFQHEYGAIGEEELIAYFELNAIGEVGIEFGRHVGAIDRKTPLIVDLEEIGDFPLGKYGVFGAGVENKLKGEDAVKDDAYDHKVIDILKRDVDLFDVPEQLDVLVLSNQRKVSKPAKDE